MSLKKPDDFLDDSSLSYVAQFRAHQDFVQAHLIGTLHDEQPLLPAFFPPSSYWTSHEKDLFFHGITVYSRLRPDLIAESIRTKSTLDVCLYLDILQSASSSIPPQINGSLRSSLEPAVEVSTRWIRNEEKIAAALIHFDSCTWSMDGDTDKPENRCVCSQSVHAVDGAQPPLMESLKESYLSHLDSTCLLTLERIIREAQSGQVNPVAVPSSALPDSPGLPVTQMCSPIEKDLSNLNLPEPSAIGSCIAVESAISKLEDERRLKKRLYMRRKRAQVTGKSANMEPNRLRPGRQPRDKKSSKPKTYKAKQKIALFNSTRKESPKNPADSETDHNVSVPTMVDKTDQEDEAQHEARSGDGLTKPYRIKNQFLQMGVNSQLMSSNDLDFFHLSSLSRLIRLYGSLNDLTTPLNKASISAGTIQLLVVILKEFISEVVRSSLVSKEQEIRLKGTSKVWKFNHEEITVENVRKTLKSMGIAQSKPKDYFAELVREGKDCTSSPDPSIDMGAEDDNYGERDGDDNGDDEISNKNTASNVSDASTQPAEPSTNLGLPESFGRYRLPKHIRVSEIDDLLSEINEIDLQRELKEEEELDVRDLLTSKDFEAGLWAS